MERGWGGNSPNNSRIKPMNLHLPIAKNLPNDPPLPFGTGEGRGEGSSGWFMGSEHLQNVDLNRGHEPTCGRAALLRSPDIWAERQLGPTHGRFMERGNGATFVSMAEMFPGTIELEEAPGVAGGFLGRMS